MQINRVSAGLRRYSWLILLVFALVAGFVLGNQFSKYQQTIFSRGYQAGRVEAISTIGQLADKGQEARLTYLDSGGKERQVVLVRKPPEGMEINTKGNVGMPGRTDNKLEVAK